MLLKTNAYLKDYGGQTKLIYFLIEYINLLNKCNTIWDQISCDIKKEVNSEPAYNKKFLKTKRKFYGDEATDFHDKEVPKKGFNYTCLAVISLDCILKRDENYYL